MTEYDESKSLTENAMKGVDITEYSISKQEREALEHIKRNIQDETVSLEEIFILKDAELAQYAGLDEQGFQKYDNYYDYCLAEEKGEFENE